MKKLSSFKTLIIIFSLILVTITSVSCRGEDTNTPGKDSSNNSNSTIENQKYSKDISETSVKIFKESIKEKENSLISPMSVLMAISMTANGAEGETLEEIEDFIGMDIEKLNNYFQPYNKESREDILEIANSIWINESKDLEVEKDFIKANEENYNAEISKLAFNEEATKKINNWVKENTNKMIEEIIDEINEEAIMYLINAMAFDGEWEETYGEDNIFDGEFTSINGENQEAEMMFSVEDLYLEDEMSTGFTKAYDGDKYSFIGILPNEDIEIEEYIESMTGEKLLNLIESGEEVEVDVTMPKFSYDYSIEMNEPLQDLGIKKAFDPEEADFSKIAKLSENIFISKVFHKTFISVDEVGTKAAAVTSVEVETTSAPIDSYFVNLDRPFVYAIFDHVNQVPIFIGTVMEIENLD